MLHSRGWLVVACTCLDYWLSNQAMWYFVHCLHCYDFSGMFVRIWFSTTPFAVWSFPFLICLANDNNINENIPEQKTKHENIKVDAFKIDRRGFAAFDACCEFCHTDKLYESSRRKPGWRFTAGCEFWTFKVTEIKNNPFIILFEFGSCYLELQSIDILTFSCASTVGSWYFC